MANTPAIPFTKLEGDTAILECSDNGNVSYIHCFYYLGFTSQANFVLQVTVKLNRVSDCSKVRDDARLIRK